MHSKELLVSFKVKWRQTFKEWNYFQGSILKYFSQKDFVSIVNQKYCQTPQPVLPYSMENRLIDLKAA